MRLLIDTQIFIWTVLDSDKLVLKARQIMLDADEVADASLRAKI
jgi:PIN domain nuclease of toxin-antitoxin system